MSAVPQVVITGVGVVSPIGIGRQAFGDALMTGQSGIGPIEIHDLGSLPVEFGGEIDGFEPKKFIKPRKAIKLMCRDIEIGFAACGLAVDDASLDTDQIDSNRFGVIHGSEMLYGPPIELSDVFLKAVQDGPFGLREFGEHFPSEMFPLWMLKYLPNMAACHVGISHQALGPNNTVVEGESSGLLALIEAVSVIERGWADVMISGGTGNRLMAANLVHLDFSNWSSRSDAPETACRPFDVDRDGMVCGEGGAAFVLETQAHAEARGAKILARVAGTGRAFGRPDSEQRFTAAIARSIEHALGSAGLTADDIDHLNANGISTLREDRLEAQAIQSVLGYVPVTAPKSFFGHLGAGAGAVELAVSLLAMAEGTVPPTLNHAQTDSSCPITVIHGEPKRVTNPAAVAISQSQTGQTAAVVVAHR